MAKDKTQIQLTLARVSSAITAQRGRMGLLQRQLDDSSQRMENLEQRLDDQLARLHSLPRLEP